MTCFNPALGRNGWVFWLAVFSLIFPLIMLYVLTVSALDSGWEPTVRLLVIMGICFVVYHFLLALCALYEASLTAKRIELYQSNIKLVTFSGKALTIPFDFSWHLKKALLDKPYHRILFQKDQKHLMLVNGNRTFYISAYTEGFEELTQKLSEYFHKPG